MSTCPARSQNVAALRPQWRAVRVAVLGATSLLLATSAHAVGGGDLPALGVLAVTAIVLGLVAVPLTARRCRTGVLLAVLGVQQTLLHLLFGSAAAHPGCDPSGLETAAHQLGAACAMHGRMGGPMADAGTTSWTMIVAHIAATIATAWLLGRGEAWLWRTAEQAIRAALGSLDGTLGRRPASLDHQLADVAVDCAGVRASGATRSTGRSLTRAEVAGAFLFLIHALPTRETVCCWHAPRVTPVLLTPSQGETFMTTTLPTRRALAEAERPGRRSRRCRARPAACDRRCPRNGAHRQHRLRFVQCADLPGTQ